MKINDKHLDSIISESVSKVLNEEALKQTIKKMVRESFESFANYNQFEESDETQKKLTKSDDGKADFNDEDKHESERRSQIEKFFHNKGVDIAPYAYQLYHIKPKQGEDSNEMKNARSKFMKCLNHEPNEAGYPYSFTSQEVNELQSMVSSNSLKESIRRNVREVLSEVVKEQGETRRGQRAIGKITARHQQRADQALRLGDAESALSHSKAAVDASNYAEKQRNGKSPKHFMGGYSSQLDNGKY